MKKKLDILKWLLPLVVLLATACGHDDLVLSDEYQEEKPDPYIELRIAVPLANPYGTRANPMGGEEGNGRERGLPNEDKVHDINIFFFEDTAGMNGEDGTSIIKDLYYNLGGNDGYNSPDIESVNDDNDDLDPYYGIKYIKLKVKYWEKDIESCKKLKFLVLANFGHIDKPNNLGDLRNLPLNEESYGMDTWIKKDPLTKDASKYDHFLMTTAYDNEYVYGGKSTGTNSITDDNKGGYYGVATVQRMYARLDLLYSKSENAPTTGSGNNEKVTELQYAVENATSNTVYLTNVLPVNVMQKPSYLFKKVTREITLFDQSGLSSASNPNNYLWGGKESTNDMPTATSPNDRPSNYVIERHTLEKDSTGTAGNIGTWYGNSRATQVKNDITSDANGKFSVYYHGSPASGNNSDERIAIISYANENTHPIDCFKSSYLTGMAFRAVYVPEKIYSGYITSTSIGADGKEVTTKVLQPLDHTVEIISGGNIYRYSPTDPNREEIKSLYFTNRTVAENYAKDHPGDMAIITSYIADKHGDKWGFICYYNLWLRHYNDVDDKNNEDEDAKSDPHEHLPMEYATVRNNIYRVSVSFSGPGDPEPTMREPDTMKARIFVRKWNYRPEDDIYFNY